MGAAKGRSGDLSAPREGSLSAKQARSPFSRWRVHCSKGRGEQHHRGLQHFRGGKGILYRGRERLLLYLFTGSSASGRWLQGWLGRAVGREQPEVHLYHPSAE